MPRPSHRFQRREAVAAPKDVQARMVLRFQLRRQLRKSHIAPRRATRALQPRRKAASERLAFWSLRALVIECAEHLQRLHKLKTTLRISRAESPRIAAWGWC